jgi:hypothetical protein
MAPYDVCETIEFLDGCVAKELSRQELNAQLCIVRDAIRDVIADLNDLSQRQLCLEKALKGELCG